MTDSVQAWFFADIGLKDRETGAVTTFRVSTRESTDARYFPILKSFSGLGLAMNGELPGESSGTVVLDNARGSFGYQRRFIDLFERFTPIEASIEVYCNFTSPTDFEPDGGKVTIFRGTIRSVSASVNELNLSVNSRQLPKRIVTKAIDPAAFPNAPSASIGRHLPIVFGSSVEVAPVLISAAGSTNPSYAFATTFHTTHAVQGVNLYFARDKGGTFRRVDSAAAVDTPVYGYTAAGNATGYTLQTTAEAIQEVNLGGPDPYVLMGGYIGVYQGTGGTINSELTIRLYTASTTTGSQREQIEEIKLTHQTTGTGYTTVYFTFREPHVVDTTKRYWIGVHRTSGGLNWARNTGNPAVGIYERLISEGDAAQWRVAFVTNGHRFGLFGLRMVATLSSTGDADGLGYASFAVSQTNLTGTQLDLTKMNWILEVSGLVDDAGGSITGSGSSLIINPRHALSLLSKRWNGAAWVDGEFDTALYSATHNAITGVSGPILRRIRGRTDGRTTWIEIVGSLMRSAACRIAMATNAAAGKNYGVWAWGYEQSSAFQFTDENAKISDIEFLGTESVVNSLQVFYDRKLSTADTTKITAEGAFADYAAGLNWYNGANGVATALTSESTTVFGTRKNATIRGDWISNVSSSVEVFARYMLGVSGRPFVMVTIETPLRRAKDLQLLQVVEILDPELPAYFGSSSDADLPNYNGTPVEIGEGAYLKRAKPYRAQIESREVSASASGIPLIRFRCRLLENYPKDPT